MAELSIQKRRSGTISGAERITGVKNAQSEMILARRLQQYNQNYRKAKLNISLEEYRLDNEARLLNLDSKTHDLDYKRRLYPNSDLSHEEMSVQNLQKYLIRNVGNQCYLDKKMGYAVRNRSSPNYIPAVVAKARLVLRKKELMVEMEEARKRMYAFMRTDMTSNRDNTFLTEVEEENEHHRDHQVMFPEILEPVSTKPQTTQQPGKSERRIQEKLQANPIVRVAFENHRKQREIEEEQRVAASPTLILSRMSRKKPPTKTDMLEETSKVQDQVDEFNMKIEELIRDYKMEEFQQGLKYVKDKDAEWNKFVEKMNQRNRAVTAVDGERNANVKSESVKQERRPVTSYVPRPVYSEKQKKAILMENLLNDVELKPEASKALPKKKGLPYHTAERMNRHSASAKLKRMVDAKKTAAVGSTEPVKGSSGVAELTAN